MLPLSLWPDAQLRVRSKGFTFVCPTEIKAFSEFAGRDCQVLAASTDSEFVHLAWCQHHEDRRLRSVVEPSSS